MSYRTSGKELRAFLPNEVFVWQFDTGAHEFMDLLQKRTWTAKGLRAAIIAAARRCKTNEMGGLSAFL